jgi:hypothetical protein
MLRDLGILALGALTLAGSGLASCSSTRAGGASRGTTGGASVGMSGGVVCVAYADKHGVEALLVRESSVDPVAFYSEARASGAAKLLGDEVMDELERYLKSAGFDEHGANGPAPRPGGAVASVLELRYADGARHFAHRGGGADQDAAAAYLDCLSNFMVLYSEVQGYQTVENAEGEALFASESARPDRNRP